MTRVSRLFDSLSIVLLVWIVTDSHSMLSESRFLETLVLHIVSIEILLGGIIWLVSTRLTLSLSVAVYSVMPSRQEVHDEEV